MFMYIASDVYTAFTGLPAIIPADCVMSRFIRMPWDQSIAPFMDWVGVAFLIVPSPSADFLPPVCCAAVFSAASATWSGDWPEPAPPLLPPLPPALSLLPPLQAVRP